MGLIVAQGLIFLGFWNYLLLTEEHEMVKDKTLVANARQWKEFKSGLLYRQNFLRHDKFSKSLKTGFSHLCVYKMTPDICKIAIIL